jgi:translation elongation factor EF-G
MVPLSEMFGYANDLRSDAGPRVVQHGIRDSYEPVPVNVANAIMESGRRLPLLDRKSR